MLHEEHPANSPMHMPFESLHFFTLTHKFPHIIYIFVKKIDIFFQRCTLLGEPTRVELLGHTEVPYAVFLDFIVAHSSAEFSSDKFSLGRTDFNSFCKEGAAFLCGAGLPGTCSCQSEAV